jgi:hypothetical protein
MGDQAAPNDHSVKLAPGLRQVKGWQTAYDYYQADCSCGWSSFMYAKLEAARQSANNHERDHDNTR